MSVWPEIVTEIFMSGVGDSCHLWWWHQRYIMADIGRVPSHRYLQFELLNECGYWTAFSMFATLTVSLNLIDWIDGTYCKVSVHVSSWIVCHEWARKQVFVTTHWDFGLFPTCTNHAVASATSFRLLLCLCVMCLCIVNWCLLGFATFVRCTWMLCCLCDCLVTCLYMRRVPYMEHNWVKHAAFRSTRHWLYNLFW